MYKMCVHCSIEIMFLMSTLFRQQLNSIILQLTSLVKFNNLFIEIVLDYILSFANKCKLHRLFCNVENTTFLIYKGFFYDCSLKS